MQRIRVAMIPPDVQRRWLAKLATSFRRINLDCLGGRLKLPTFTLLDTEGRLGQWDAKGRIIGINVEHLAADTWTQVEETLRHEMAHQVVLELFTTEGAPAHGELFKRACTMLEIDAAARGEAASPEHLRVVERIRKLLNLANSTNAHEAQAAMSEANRLLLKHNIAIADSGGATEHVYKYLGQPVGRVSTELKLLSGILQEHFFVRCLWIRTTFAADDRPATLLEITGTPDNIELAEYTYDYLLNVLEDFWVRYRASTRAKASDRSAYRVGVLMGFRDHLSQQQKVNEERGLIWLGDPGTDEYFAKRHPRTRSMARGTYRPGSAHARGLADGATLRIRPGMKTPSTSGGGRLLPGR
jgi:hypothetical protein